MVAGQGREGFRLRFGWNGAKAGELERVLSLGLDGMVPWLRNKRRC